MYRQANKNMSSAQLGIFCVCLEIVYNTKVEGLLTVYQKQKISKDLEKKYFFKEILLYIIIQLLTFSSLSVNGNKTFVIMT